eukprot:5606735-Pyramimonas_sp.AAC.1
MEGIMTPFRGVVPSPEGLFFWQGLRVGNMQFSLMNLTGPWLRQNELEGTSIWAALGMVSVHGSFLQVPAQGGGW